MNIGTFGFLFAGICLNAIAQLLLKAGANAVGAAIASAIDDAIGAPGAVTQLPITPERLRDLIRAQTAR